MQTAMETIFMLHSWWRWVVLLLAVVAILKALAGWFGRQGWTNVDDLLSRFYVIAFSVQFVLGLIVYVGVLIGVHAPKWYNLSLMRLSTEHVLMMTVAMVIAMIARGRSRRAGEALAKHRTVAIGFLISLLVVVLSVPTWSASV